jgi:hypothetical protein
VSQQLQNDDILVYKTFQMYRRNSLRELDNFIGLHENSSIGVKLVRGAYLSQDKDKCFANKSCTDANYNEGLRILLTTPHISAVIATHNKTSVDLAKSMLMNKTHNKFVHFAQLLGMADALGNDLVSDGFSVYKYIPYGNPIEIGPYLARRLIENIDILQHR